MAVGRPAAQNDAQDAHGRHGRDHQQADIHVRHVEFLRKKAARRNAVRPVNGGNHRREPEDGVVRAGGNDIFLQQQLQRIGDGLQQAVRPHAHGSQADLEVRQDLALHQREVAGDQRNHRDDDQRQHDGREQRIERILSIWSLPRQRRL